MFELPAEYMDRIGQAFVGRVCTAPDGSYILRSEGSSKTGRDPWYHVVFSDGRHSKFRARSDNEAVEKANLLDPPPAP